MGYFKKFILRYRILITTLIVTSIVASIMEGLSLSLVIPLFEGVRGQGVSGIPFPFNAVSSFFGSFDISQRVRLIAGLLVGLTLVKGAMLYLNSILSFRLQENILKYYWSICFRHLMFVRMGYIQAQKASHLQTVASVYIHYIGRFIGAMGQLIPQIFTVLILLTMLILLSWPLTLISVIIFSTTFFITRGMSGRAGKIGKGLVESEKEINRIVLDTILGMKIVRLFRQEGEAITRLQSEVDRYALGSRGLAKLKSSTRPVLENVGVASLAIILVISSFVILNNGSGLEIILSFILISLRLITPLSSLSQVGVTIAGDIPYFKAVHNFLDASEQMYIKDGQLVVSEFKESIEIRDIKFSYQSQEAFVLKGLSFTIRKGSKIGIVGSSGSGKSTIIDVLLRFCDPQSGQILVDGVDLRTINVASWYRQIGVVTQDTFLFNDTIFNNIAYAKEGASQSEVEQAAAMAYADNFIRELPEGYETKIGDRGVLLSGGERQRIAIARAMLGNPEILIFDEATSSLDSESERIVQEAIRKISEGRTVIAVAHRLSTLIDFDSILVIDGGMISGYGTHHDLLQQNTLYRKFVEMQTL